MTILNSYKGFVKQGSTIFDVQTQEILCGMGIAGEAGEVCEILKKASLLGGPLDREHLTEELGDVFWHILLNCHTFGITLEEVMEYNIRKLCARHPERYSKPEDWLGENQDNRLPD